MSLTKADIVERVYKEAGFSKKEAADLVDLVFKIIKDTLSKAKKLKFQALVTFQLEINQLVLVVTHKLAKQWRSLLVEF